MANEEEFRVKVVTTADGKGAQQAAQDLGKVEDKAKAAGEAGAKGGEKLEEGLNKGAKAAEKASDGLDKFSKSAKKANDETDHSTEKLKGLGEAGEATEYGFRSTAELAESLGMILKGDLATGALQGGGAIEALSKALLGGPWGIAAVALGALASVVALFATNSDKAEDKAEDLATSVGKLSPKTRELAEKMLELAKAAGQQAEKTGQAKSPIDQIAESFKKAADEAERYKSVRDQLVAQDTAIAIAETNLAEATGKISSEQAAATRSAIDYASKTKQADNAAIASTYEKNRALEQLHKAERAKQAADAEAYRAGKDFEAKGGQLPMSPESLAQQLKDAEDTVKKNEKIVLGGADPSGQAWKSIEAAKARDKERLAQLQQLAAAYARLAEAEDKAKAAQEALKEASKNEKEAGEKANRDLKQQQVDREVAQKEAQTSAAKAANESAKGDRDFRSRAEQSRERAIQGARRLDDARQPEAETPAPAAHGGTAPAGPDLLQRSRDVAAQGAGIKGRSPEKTQELQSALKKFEDGASGEELDQAASIVAEIAQSLGKVNQSREQQLRAFETELRKLRGEVERMKSYNGGTGS